MPSIQLFRRSITALTFRVAKQASTTTASAIRAPFYTLAKVTRQRYISSSTRRTPSRPQIQNRQPRRWLSDDEQSLKQWGFDTINAALPGTKPNKDFILVDVREPAELKSTGIIPSAVSVPLASQPDALFLTPEEFETRFGYPKPGAAAGEKGDIVFYCKAGVRARAAAQLAVQAGYDPERIGVYNGSWLDWAERGGKVEK
ncbi:hypothetical protein BBP40_010572 [Aspergillus hancockii]|nr:hypothetical protein BBP40_010572 [Aspergillus hancockii]